MLKGIVFDLDGTLVDSLATTFDAFNRGITLHGGKALSAREIMSYFGPGETEIFAKIVGPENAASAYDAARKHMDENIGHVPLHAGVGDLLEALKSQGTPVSIFTGRSWDTTEMILKHHRLLDRFITVVANDHVNQPKPSPEGLILAAKRMGMSPDEVILVGDSWTDMRAARSANSQGTAALWDWMAKREELEPHQPHHWAEKPAEIVELWKRISE